VFRDVRPQTHLPGLISRHHVQSLWATPSCARVSPIQRCPHSPLGTGKGGDSLNVHHGEPTQQTDCVPLVTERQQHRTVSWTVTKMCCFDNSAGPLGRFFTCGQRWGHQDLEEAGFFIAESAEVYSHRNRSSCLFIVMHMQNAKFTILTFFCFNAGD
jgi:hypothetical protein